jgi:hypothetical protein
MLDWPQIYFPWSNASSRWWFPRSGSRYTRRDGSSLLAQAGRLGAESAADALRKGFAPAHSPKKEVVNIGPESRRLVDKESENLPAIAAALIGSLRR